MSIRRTHTDNPQHPAAIVGFAIFLIGFGAAPLALTALAFGSGTAALVAAIVRAAYPPEVDSAALAHLHSASGGNLVYLRHLVEGSVDSGALVLDDGVWRFRRPPEGTPLLADLLRRPLQPLSERARELADLVALRTR